jgi:O-antigen/teichoic acid export membrane protein
MNGSEEDAQPRRGSFLIRNAASLVSTSVVTSALGFVYWTVAARMFAVTDVGESTTAISAMSLMAPFTVLGFGTALISKLPTMRSGRAELVSTAVTICALAALMVSLACALILPPRFTGLPGVGHSVAATLLFVGGVVAHAVALLLDSALLSAVGGGVQLRRNTIHAVVKLALLVLFAFTLRGYGALGIYASWFLAAVISILVVGVGLIRDYRLPLRELRPRLSSLDGLHFHAVKHHMLNLSLSVPVFSMPIIANVILGSEKAGYLYATWSLAGFVFTLPISMSIALFAAGAKDPSAILREFRFSLRLSMAATVAANLLILPFGAAVLGIFGPAYAANGHTVLIILCLGGFGLVIRDHHMAVARITGDVGREAVLMTVASVGELVGAAIGAHLGGLIGLSTGWVIAVTLEGLVFAPRVWRTYRGHFTVGGRAADDGDGELQPRQANAEEQ